MVDWPRLEARQRRWGHQRRAEAKAKDGLVLARADLVGLPGVEPD
jgi:hypothetical protein